jgi:asparaginyl-tRNA synthetase|uniref:Asparagine--tRNA ligase n=1 Tax=Desulfomonile tiedjei TaxID=2358 RepID=A0A7C4ASF0_9BACT
MDWISIDRVADHVGRRVELRGWVSNKRSSGKIRFVQLRDGAGVIQCVFVAGKVPERAFEAADRIPYESSVVLVGQVTQDPRSPSGYEIAAEDMQIISEAEPYPISKKDHGVGFLMDHRHLWLRSSRQVAMMRIRSALTRSARAFFDEQGFVSVEAPILTPTACEGTTSLFEVAYFDRSAYLTQSGQLYGEAAAMALGKIYVFGPTFRAEKSKTRRHLTEFWMIEPEMAFWDLEQTIELAEALVCRIVADVLAVRRPELQLLERDVSLLENIKSPFPRITYSEAVEMLKAEGMPFEWGDDFGADEEAVLSQKFEKPVFVTRYPADVKAFYMKRDPDDPRLALAVDLLAPEGYGEIIGGGQREDSLALLEERIQQHGLDPAPLQWYLDLRRYGSAPHAGFGLGIERTLAWIAGVHHVRETIAFPRLMDRLYP